MRISSVVLCSLLGLMSLSQAHAAATDPIVVASPRKDENSMQGHQDHLAKVKAGKIDLYFLGDSITRRWGALDYPHFLSHWNESFRGWNAGNFGWGGDTVENILWRIENGEMEGLKPKAIVILAGTNNLRKGFTSEDGKRLGMKIQYLAKRCQELAPSAKVILLGILPRNDIEGIMPIIREINADLASFAPKAGIQFLDISDRLADKDGVLREGMSKDKLHLELPGYAVWADALQPLLTSILGPKAATDEAPPPTGDPKAMKAAKGA